MTVHVVQFSTGVGSAYTAKLVIDRNPDDKVLLLFADVARDGGEWWEGEDPDNYRFANDIVEALDVELVTVRDGRGVWGLAAEQRMIPNNRAPFCSRILKHEPCQQWLTDNCDPATTVLHVGIDITEAHRCEPIVSRWAPWQVEFPLMQRPYPLKTDALAWCRSIGVDPPRMYTEVFKALEEREQEIRELTRSERSSHREERHAPGFIRGVSDPLRIGGAPSALQ